MAWDYEYFKIKAIIFQIDIPMKRENTKKRRLLPPRVRRGRGEHRIDLVCFERAMDDGLSRGRPSDDSRGDLVVSRGSECAVSFDRPQSEIVLRAGTFCQCAWCSVTLT